MDAGMVVYTRLSFGVIIDYPGYRDEFYVTDDFGNLVSPPFWQVYWQLRKESQNRMAES